MGRRVRRGAMGWVCDTQRARQHCVGVACAGAWRVVGHRRVVVSSCSLSPGGCSVGMSAKVFRSAQQGECVRWVPLRFL